MSGGDSFRKVKPGDPLVVPAATYNAFIDTTIAFRKQAATAPGAVGGQPGAAHPTTVWVKNSSGSDVAMFGVIGLGDALFTPAAAPDTFKSDTAIVGAEPEAGTHDGRFAIAQEPIANGKLGRCLVVGMTWTQVAVSDAAHSYADIADGDVAKLASSTSGAAQIVYKPSGTGTLWCLVRMGTPIPQSFWARITGSAAADTPAQGRWTYSWAEVSKTAAGYEGWTNGSLTGTNTAFNTIEDMNPASAGLQGNGVDASGTDYPAGFALKPAPTGAIVRMYPVTFDATTEYWFTYENADDGTCEAT